MIFTKLISCVSKTDALDGITKDLGESTKKFNSMSNSDIPPTQLEIESAVADLTKITDAANRRFNLTSKKDKKDKE